MIYLVLEHIPRALYALNEKGKTFFYNDHFENIFTLSMNCDVDIKFIETSLADPEKNSFFHSKDETRDIQFYNKDMKFYYEKAPLISNGKTIGYLIFCDKNPNKISTPTYPGIGMENLSLKEKLSSIERSIIVETIQESAENLSDASVKLKITKKLLTNKMEKLGIDINNS